MDACARRQEADAWVGLCASRWILFLGFVVVSPHHLVDVDVEAFLPRTGGLRDCTKLNSLSPAVGDTVDASYTNSMGEPYLNAFWIDPDFDPKLRAVLLRAGTGNTHAPLDYL